MIEKIDCSKDGIHIGFILFFFFLAFSLFFFFYIGKATLDEFPFFFTFSSIMNYDLHDDVRIPLFLSHFFSFQVEMRCIVSFLFACARLGGLVF